MANPTITVNDEDVMFGRGGQAYRHPGNRFFRRLVQYNKDLYRDAENDRCIKHCVARSIVMAISRRGGRFLRKEQGGNHGGFWVEVTTEGEKERKTAQALRDNTPPTSPVSFTTATPINEDKVAQEMIDTHDFKKLLHSFETEDMAPMPRPHTTTSVAGFKTTGETQDCIAHTPASRTSMPYSRHQHHSHQQDEDVDEDEEEEGSLLTQTVFDSKNDTSDQTWSSLEETLYPSPSQKEGRAENRSTKGCETALVQADEPLLELFDGELLDKVLGGLEIHDL